MNKIEIPERVVHCLVFETWKPIENFSELNTRTLFFKWANRHVARAVKSGKHLDLVNKFFNSHSYSYSTHSLNLVPKFVGKSGLVFESRIQWNLELMVLASNEEILNKKTWNWLKSIRPEKLLYKPIVKSLFCADQHLVDMFNDADWIAHIGGEKIVMTWRFSDIERHIAKYDQWLANKYSKEEKVQFEREPGQVQELFYSLDRSWYVAKLVDQKAYNHTAYWLKNCLAAYSALSEINHVYAIRSSATHIPFIAFQIYRQELNLVHKDTKKRLNVIADYVSQCKQAFNKEAPGEFIELANLFLENPRGQTLKNFVAKGWHLANLVGGVGGVGRSAGNGWVNLQTYSRDDIPRIFDGNLGQAQSVIINTPNNSSAYNELVMDYHRRETRAAGIAGY